MECTDSRRLTGPNLHLSSPGVVAEVSFGANEDPKSFVTFWTQYVQKVMTRFGLDNERVFVRLRAHHASVGFSGPIDALYAATEMNEWAIEAAIAAATDAPVPSLASIESVLQESLQAERRPRLLALEQAAHQHQVPFLWDDDLISVGYGSTALVWPYDAIPEPQTILWGEPSTIPVALITGTNGKTTTSRMLTRILTHAGFAVGSTSSDGVCVKEAFVEPGDWTGPGAARMVMRRPEIDAAVLEAARGGLLRRGVGVNRCTVAIVTNVSDDHLGEYGVETVEDMAETKALIATVVEPHGLRVLNADDPHAERLTIGSTAPIAWFSMLGCTPFIEAHCQAGGEAWYYHSDSIVHRKGSEETHIMPIRDIPCVLEGAALHNVANALAAAAGAKGMGTSMSHIVSGLQTFGRERTDNPGRCQQFDIDPFHLIIDFAHNPAGVRATLQLAQVMMANQGYKRLCVSIGQAGDRSDASLHALAHEILLVEPQKVLLRQIEGYERGRAPYEVPRILQSYLTTRGFPADKTSLCRDELDALQQADQWAEPGDLVLHLIHIQREPVEAWLSLKMAR